MSKIRKNYYRRDKTIRDILEKARIAGERSASNFVDSLQNKEAFFGTQFSCQDTEELGEQGSGIELHSADERSSHEEIYSEVDEVSSLLNGISDAMHEGSSNFDEQEVSSSNESLPGSADHSLYSATQDSSCIFTDDSLSDTDDILPVFLKPSEGQSICEHLIQWALGHRITHQAFTSLLKILNKFHPEHNLPADGRCLLKTRRKLDIATLSDGCGFKYFGLAVGLCKLLKDHKSGLPRISLLINVDGLPLYRSSGMSFWPILVSIKEIDSEPWMVALYCGPKKPPLNEFLQEFLSELYILQKDGLAFANSTLEVSVLAFVCDAPARQFLKKCKGHTGYYGCEKCKVEGNYKNHTVSFEETNCSLRADADFVDLQNDDPHIQEVPSPLVAAGFGLVSNFPLDYMHLVLLGVMRRLLTLWTKEFPIKLCRSAISRINEEMEASRKFIPSEFARKPRSLDYACKWKATELRLFLLYVGPIVLKGIIPRDYFHHFMLLSSAIRILCSEDCLSDDNLFDYAKKLLRKFVETWQSTYPDTSIVYNVHSLIHLPDDVKRTGTLDSWSAFRYENYLGKLKRLIRSGNRPLVQVCRRIYEYLDSPRASIQLEDVQRFRIYPCKNSDNCALLNNGSYCLVNSIHNNQISVQKFRKPFDLFTQPCESSILKITCFKKLDDKVSTRCFSEIKTKCMVVKEFAYWVIIPYLH